MPNKKKSLMWCILGISMILGIYYIYNICFAPISNSYSRNIYSVVLYNNTNDLLDNITVSYGAENTNNSSCRFAKITDMKPKEYRKINIPTSSPSQDADIPYNVWIDVLTNFGEKDIIAGYFGINTGGFAVIKISRINNELVLQRVFRYEKEYNNLYRRNRKNQQELSWY